MVVMMIMMVMYTQTHTPQLIFHHRFSTSSDMLSLVAESLKKHACELGSSTYCHIGTDICGSLARIFVLR